MATEMATRYDPTSVEQRWYAIWDERGYFKPREPKRGRGTFTISMPPPNITGDLHMGHAMYTLQDVLIRWHRMLGDSSLWVPGTDHAAIATQNVIEKQLAREKTSKEEIGREAFERRVQEWYASTGSTILEQMRRLGFSADWSRMRFTMDPAYVDAIRYVFVELWREGLIYRGPRIVNWCPRDLSSISDLEVVYEEADDQLYYLIYPVEGGGQIRVATARPETMVGDTAVAVQGQDSRYRDLIGKHAILPLIGRRLPIVADDAVDPEFGTGAVKVTPGHDATDYEIGERHKLPVLDILHPNGTMNIKEVPELDGLPVKQARAKIVEMLKQAGALEKVEPYRHSVGHCDRCGAVIEPLVSPQWWVRMKGLAQPAIEVAEKDDLRFHPARWREAYLRWLYNIRDWCISRQIWLGHRIPVWTCANGHQVAYRNDPQRCSECGNGDLAQDPDVLDTWFSSALWPFATLGWPAKTEDLRRFYPTQLLDTGRDILYLWVARMVFMGLHFTQVSPFSDVLIHGTVLATDGRRMSKSLGTGVDPLEMIARYGADATRAWCSYFGTTGQDIRFSEEKIKSYQLFANKLWNAVRLVISRLDSKESNSALSAADRWILGRLSLVTRQVTSAFERFDFGPAIDLLYEFLWHELADYHLEWMKAGLASPQVSATVLERALRLLHPIMPFVTEELWQRLPHDGETIMYASWPEPDATVEDGQLATEMGHLLEVVRAVRNVRQQLGDPVSRLKAHLESTRPMMTQAEGRGYLATLARLDLDGTLPDSQASVVVGETRVALAVGAKKGAERERLESELRRAEADIQSLRTKLDNPGFTSRAPADVVARERERLTRLRETADRLRKSLDAT